MHVLPLLIGVLVALEHRPTPNRIEGTVLEVRPDGGVLLSLGSVQGAKMGMMLLVYRQPKMPSMFPNATPFGFLDEVEVVQVGLTQSIARRSPRSFYLPGQVRKADGVVWRSPQAANEPYWAPPELRRSSRSWYQEGAIIDLTRPKREP